MPVNLLAVISMYMFVSRRFSIAVRPLGFTCRDRFFSHADHVPSFSGETSSSRLLQNAFFSEDHETFRSMGVSSTSLLDRLEANPSLNRPTAIQAQAYRKIQSGKDCVLGAETGSGKTLAYLLPLVDEILTTITCDLKEKRRRNYVYCRAVILVPNKELANQVLRMASDVCGGVIVGNEDRYDQNDSDKLRLALLPGGLESPNDFRPFRKKEAVDLLVCTPAALGSFGSAPKHIDFFADIRTLVVDEADMLLDGGYVRELERVFLGFRRADRLANRYSTGFVDGTGGSDENSLYGMLVQTQHVFVGATIPDYGLKSVDAYIAKKFPHTDRIYCSGFHAAMHNGLAEQTLWFEQDSDDNKKERLQEFVQLYHNMNLKEEKIMVFLNSVEDVDAVVAALGRINIYALPYHAKIPLQARAGTLDEFRAPDQPSLLVCTDLAARGLDVPGVTTVVQLQFAGNVVAHLHRMGRCGRAGNRNGRGIVFYGPQEKALVEKVRDAESSQDNMTLSGAEVDADKTFEDTDERSPSIDKGNIREAFSRKRGFSKKRKKTRKEAFENE